MSSPPSSSGFSKKKIFQKEKVLQERFQKENERLLTEYVARLESERLFEGNQTNGLVVPGTNDVAYVSNYDAKDFAGSKGGDNQSD